MALLSREARPARCRSGNKLFAFLSLVILSVLTALMWLNTTISSRVRMSNVQPSSLMRSSASTAERIADLSLLYDDPDAWLRMFDGLGDRQMSYLFRRNRRFFGTHRDPRLHLAASRPHYMVNAEGAPPTSDALAVPPNISRSTASGSASAAVGIAGRASAADAEVMDMEPPPAGESAIKFMHRRGSNGAIAYNVCMKAEGTVLYTGSRTKPLLSESSKFTIYFPQQCECLCRVCHSTTQKQHVT
jgi:hypothetical protein